MSIWYTNPVAIINISCSTATEVNKTDKTSGELLSKHRLASVIGGWHGSVGRGLGGPSFKVFNPP